MGSEALVYKLNQKNGRNLDSMYHFKFNSKQKEITVTRAEMCRRNRQKNSWLHNVLFDSFELELCKEHYELCATHPHFPLDFLTITTHSTKQSVFTFLRCFVCVFLWLKLFTFSIQGLVRFIKMASPLVVMFLSTRSQTIVHDVSRELWEIGIENFQILSMLFSYLHFAFTTSLGREDAATSAAYHSTCWFQKGEAGRRKQRRLPSGLLQKQQQRLLRPHVPDS